MFAMSRTLDGVSGNSHSDSGRSYSPSVSGLHQNGQRGPSTGLSVDTSLIDSQQLSPSRSSGPITAEAARDAQAFDFPPAFASTNAGTAERVKLRRAFSYDPRFAWHGNTPMEEEEHQEQWDDDLDQPEELPPLVGPPTELQAALEAAELATARVGAGAGSFCFKLYALLVDPSHRDLCGFTENGRAFRVYNSIRFSKEVLPKQFKHSNFASFVRQLNMYAFHKVNKFPRAFERTEETVYEFAHPKFLYGRPQLLDDIKRKPAENVSSAGTKKIKVSTRSRAHQPIHEEDLEVSSELDSPAEMPSPWRGAALPHSPATVAPTHISGAPSNWKSSLPIITGPPMSSAFHQSYPRYSSTAPSMQEYQVNERVDTSPSSVSHDRLGQLELEYINLRFDHETIESRLIASERKTSQIVDVLQDVWNSFGRSGIPTPYPFPTSLHHTESHGSIGRHNDPYGSPRSATGSIHSTWASSPAAFGSAPHSAPPTSQPFDMWTHPSPVMSSRAALPSAFRSAGPTSSSFQINNERPSNGSSFQQQQVESSRTSVNHAGERPGPDSLAPAIDKRPLAAASGNKQQRRRASITPLEAAITQLDEPERSVHHAPSSSVRDDPILTRPVSAVEGTAQEQDVDMIGSTAMDSIDVAGFPGSAASTASYYSDV